MAETSRVQRVDVELAQVRLAGLDARDKVRFGDLDDYARLDPGDGSGRRPVAPFVTLQLTNLSTEQHLTRHPDY